MKKTFLFAFALVASVLAFVSCDKKDKKSDEPTNTEEITTDVNPADYINTMWRIDSCLAGGEKQRPPHGFIRVLKNNLVAFNNDTSEYSFKDGKLIFRGEEFTIAGLKKGWAHLQARGTDIYLCQLPALDTDDIIMEHQASDFVGTWKHAYYSMDAYTPGEPTWHIEGSNPWVETWEFKADGTCIYKDYFTGETVTGTWECDQYQIRFSKNPAEGTVIEEGEPITVQPLTKNWMQILRGTGSGSTTTYYYWWFYRVK